VEKEERELSPSKDKILHGQKTQDQIHTCLNHSTILMREPTQPSLLMLILKVSVEWPCMPKSKLLPLLVMIAPGKFGTWKTKKIS
jgi:hypothetical protein